MEGADIVESPRKRIKTDNATGADESVIPPSSAQPAAAEAEEDAQASKEMEVGITAFVSSENQGFAGILKKRLVIPLDKQKP